MKLFRSVCLLAMSSLALASAQASTPSLLGSDVSLTILYPTQDNPISNTATSVVSDSVEFTTGALNTLPSFGGTLIPVVADIDASSITMSFTDLFAAYGSASFNGGLFSFNSALFKIVGATLDASATSFASGLVVTYDADSVWINGPGLTFDKNSSVKVNLQLAAVPEPGAVGMSLAGLAVAGLLARRRKAA